MLHRFNCVSVSDIESRDHAAFYSTARVGYDILRESDVKVH